MSITVYSKPACVQCTATTRALDCQGLDTGLSTFPRTSVRSRSCRGSANCDELRDSADFHPALVVLRGKAAKSGTWQLCL